MIGAVPYAVVRPVLEQVYAAYADPDADFEALERVVLCAGREARQADEDAEERGEHDAIERRIVAEDPFGLSRMAFRVRQRRTLLRAFRPRPR